MDWTPNLDETMDWTTTGWDYGLDDDWVRLRIGRRLDETMDWRTTGWYHGLDDDWVRPWIGRRLGETMDWTTTGWYHGLDDDWVRPWIGRRLGEIMDWTPCLGKTMDWTTTSVWHVWPASWTEKWGPKVYSRQGTLHTRYSDVTRKFTQYVIHTLLYANVIYTVINATRTLPLVDIRSRTYANVSQSLSIRYIHTL